MRDTNRTDNVMAQRVMFALADAMDGNELAAPDIRAIVERAILPAEPMAMGAVVVIKDHANNTRLTAFRQEDQPFGDWWDGRDRRTWAELCALGMVVEYVAAPSARDSLAHTICRICKHGRGNHTGDDNFGSCLVGSCGCLGFAVPVLITTLGGAV